MQSRKMRRMFCWKVEACSQCLQELDMNLLCIIFQGVESGFRSFSEYLGVCAPSYFDGLLSCRFLLMDETFLLDNRLTLRAM